MNAKKSTVKPEAKKPEAKKPEAKKPKVAPKWGTADWAYANAWTDMTRKQRARVTALGVFRSETKVILDLLNSSASVLRSYKGVTEKTDMCPAFRQLYFTAHDSIFAAVCNLEFLVDEMVAKDLDRAWTKKDK